MIDRTTSVIRESGIDFQVYDSDQQAGDCFGTRIANAYRFGFDLGYSHIIVVGNDCPELTAEHLVDAKNKLAYHDAVVGPSHDGGVYLLGLSKKSYEEIGLNNLPWETNQLASALETQLKVANISSAHLERLADIDQVSSSTGLRRRLQQLGVSASLLILIFRIKDSFSYRLDILVRIRYCIDLTGRRGPPLMS